MFVVMAFINHFTDYSSKADYVISTDCINIKKPNESVKVILFVRYHSYIHSYILSLSHVMLRTDSVSSSKPVNCNFVTLCLDGSNNAMTCM